MVNEQEPTIEVPVSLAKRLIDDLLRMQGLLQAQKPEDEVIVPGQGTWTRSQVQRLRAEVGIYPAAYALLDLAAEKADEEMSYEDLVKSTGMERNQVRAELGAMTRLARRLFDEKKWPLRVRQAKDGSIKYTMQRGIADWWLDNEARPVMEVRSR